MNIHGYVQRFIYIIFACVCGGIFIHLLMTPYIIFDDLDIIGYSVQHTYSEIWRSPTVGSPYQYRPLIAVLAKFIYSVFAWDSLGTRLVQTFCMGSGLFLMYKSMRKIKVHPFPIVLALASFLGSPFSKAAFLSWAECLHVFYVSVLVYLFLHTDTRGQKALLIGITILALLSKEIGLVIAAVTCIYFWAQKAYRYSGITAVIVCVYFLIRLYVLGSLTSASDSDFGTGFFTKVLSKSDVALYFSGGKIYALYSYNVLCNIFTIFFNQPSHGQFSLNPFPLLKIVRFFLYSFSSYFIFRHSFTSKYRPLSVYLMLFIIFNGMIVYVYCRSRLLPYSGVAYTMLLAIGIHQDLCEKKRQKYMSTAIVLLCAGWLIHANLFHAFIFQSEKGLISSLKTGKTSVHLKGVSPSLIMP